MMNEPMFSYKMESEYKKIYIWKTTKEQLINARNISLELCSNICSCLIARIIETAIKIQIYKMMGEECSTKTCLEDIQSWQKELKFLQTNLPYIIKNQIVGLLMDKCGQEQDRAMAYKIDIPKESFSTNVTDVLHCLAKEANIIESYDILTKDYWVKPETSIEYKEIRKIIV